jgi:hypothetical protein
VKIRGRVASSRITYPAAASSISYPARAPIAEGAIAPDLQHRQRHAAVPEQRPDAACGAAVAAVQARAVVLGHSRARGGVLSACVAHAVLAAARALNRPHHRDHREVRPGALSRRWVPWSRHRVDRGASKSVSASRLPTHCASARSTTNMASPSSAMPAGIFRIRLTASSTRILASWMASLKHTYVAFRKHKRPSACPPKKPPRSRATSPPDSAGQMASPSNRVLSASSMRSGRPSRGRTARR